MRAAPSSMLDPMELRSLTSDDLEAMLGAFLAAFGDYAVELRMDLAKLERMTRRRGIDFGASVGVFDPEADGAMVAVQATGVGEWEGERAGYDIFTGVAPSHRGRGLAGAMLEHSKPRLAERGARRFVLEVLQSNAPAIRAYRGAGFELAREFECFDGLERVEDRSGGAVEVRRVEAPDWAALEAWFDWRPSWQNSVASMRRAGGDVETFAAVVAGETAGYAIVEPIDGDLAVLAVDPRHRRRGVGAALVARSASRRTVNVPADATGDLAFWSALGADRFVRQYEMTAMFA